jgi:hypothetical protein
MMPQEGTTMRPRLVLHSLLAATLLLACGDDTGGAGGSGTGGGGGAAPADLDAEACEHISDGPFVQHLAAETVADAPDVSAEHTAHDVVLVELDGVNGGFVSFQAPAAGEYVFFLDQDVPLSIQSSAGADVLVEERCDPAACSPTCALVRGRLLVDLAVGTYYLELGPTDLPSVHLLHEAIGVAHED